MADKIRQDFRKSVEFLMKVTPYDEPALLRKDFIEFFEILKEAEAEQMALIAKQKEQQR